MKNKACYEVIYCSSNGEPYPLQRKKITIDLIVIELCYAFICVTHLQAERCFPTICGSAWVRELGGGSLKFPLQQPCSAHTPSRGSWSHTWPVLPKRGELMNIGLFFVVVDSKLEGALWNFGPIYLSGWVGQSLGSFSKVGIIFNPVVGFFSLSLPPPGLSEYKLCAACWAFHGSSWIVAIIIESSLLSIVLKTLLEVKINRKLLCLSLDSFFKIFALPGCFHYVVFYRYLSHYFIQDGLLLQ